MAKVSSPILGPILPQEPIHRLTKPLDRFLHVEAASGIFLLLCAVIALALANSPVADAYLSFWTTPIGIAVGDFQLTHSLKHWINDGLMAIFFFVIGLEVKRELAVGQLKQLRSATLPLAAALGGMVVPAALYVGLQAGEAGQRGWGVPMATDIAFVVGCMAILGERVPTALRVMLLSLAIVDDIGAILVIALGYSEALHWSWLGIGVIGIVAIIFMQRLGVRSIAMYTAIGAMIWLCFHESGVHATIAGVILGAMTPARPYLAGGVGGQLLRRASELLHEGDWEQESPRPVNIRQYRWAARETVSPLEYLIYVLHPWVAFLIMPLFALANAGVAFQASDVTSSVSLAVVLGLTIGKPLGIVLFCWLALQLRVAQFPAGITWRQIVGGGFLAGIGFTMALFISGLAFEDGILLRQAKVGVLAGSVLSAIIGIGILLLVSQRGGQPSDQSG
jgi:Na+:H+ antiporter, NhaA family